jgi:hypothetical protein
LYPTHQIVFYGQYAIKNQYIQTPITGINCLAARCPDQRQCSIESRHLTAGSCLLWGDITLCLLPNINDIAAKGLTQLFYEERDVLGQDTSTQGYAPSAHRLGDLPPQNWTESGWNFLFLQPGLMNGIFHEALETA